MQILRLKSQGLPESRNFRFNFTGELLRSRQPRPNIWPIRLPPRCGLQVKNGCCRLSQVAIVNPKEEICSRKTRLDRKSAAELGHRAGNAILQLVNKAKIHVNLSETRNCGEHGTVFTLGSCVIIALLSFLPSAKVGANPRAALGLGFNSLS